MTLLNHVMLTEGIRSIEFAGGHSAFAAGRSAAPQRVQSSGILAVAAETRLAELFRSVQGFYDDCCLVMASQRFSASVCSAQHEKQAFRALLQCWSTPSAH